MSTPEHREFTRIRCAFPVVLDLADRQVDGSTRDLSMNGALITLDQPPAQGSEVRVRILLAGHGGSPVIHAVGTVARSGAGQCAVAFRELVGEESYHHLSRIILHNAEDPRRVEEECASHLGLKRIDG
jgi:hypothetical protein